MQTNCSQCGRTLPKGHEGERCSQCAPQSALKKEWLTKSGHVIPLYDLRAHGLDEDCWCGPTAKTEGKGDWWYVHHSLDGREHEEPDHDRGACPLCSSVLATP